MKLLMLTAALVVGFAVQADQQLRAIARIESRGNHAAVGEAGERGAWQLSKGAWSQVNRLRKERHERRYAFSSAHEPGVAVVYAQEYREWLVARFNSARTRPPTDGELYALWNLGFEGFRKRGFDLTRCPASTRRGAVAMNDAR